MLNFLEENPESLYAIHLLHYVFHNQLQLSQLEVGLGHVVWETIRLARPLLGATLVM